MSETNNTPAETTPQVKGPSERFMENVIAQYSAMPGEVQLTNFQKKLIQNYYIKLDQVLKAAEVKRLKQSEDKREQLAYVWKNVNIEKLAVDVVAYSSVGMDPLQPNHINLIPYKDSRTQKYDITFMLGYRGIELKAMKYGIDPLPKDVRIEIVHANDEFIPYKKDRVNGTETYDFRIVKPFDRGPVVGGFYHLEYEDASQNQMRIFSKAQIDKRKPEYASTEFWGGTKTKWENGKAAGKVEVEGWYDEMAWKTIARSAYNSITIDSQKIDDHFISMMQQESAAAQVPQDAGERVQDEINQNAMTEDVTFKLEETTMQTTTLFTNEEGKPEPEKAPAKTVKKEPKAKEQSAPKDETEDQRPPFE